MVVGDIHGALRALVQVLDRCGFDNRYDSIVFLGDYVDGWPESSEVVDFLIELQEGSEHGHIFIRGNHDVWCSDWLNSFVPNINWTDNGGKTTIESYFDTGLYESEAHRKFFRTLHDYYIDDDNNGFVHGGYVSRKGLGHDTHRSNYHWDRDLWSLALMSHGRKHESELSNIRRFEIHNEVFLGHTSTMMWNCKRHYPEYHISEQPSKNGPITVPMNRYNVWNMDTGAGYNGKLTIMDVETKDFWQSDSVDELYPNNKGR